VALEWKHSTDGVDWEELSALYRAAPLGDKKPLVLPEVWLSSHEDSHGHLREPTATVGAGLPE
jgi:hypothetical protein